MIFEMCFETTWPMKGTKFKSHATKRSFEPADYRQKQCVIFADHITTEIQPLQLKFIQTWLIISLNHKRLGQQY